MKKPILALVLTPILAVQNGATMPNSSNVTNAFAWKGAIDLQDKIGAVGSDDSGSGKELIADPRATPTPAPTPMPLPNPPPKPLPVSTDPCPQIPEAVAAGYTHTAFDSRIFNSNSVSPDDTGTHQWYPYNGFDGTNEPKPTQWTVNRDGSLTFLTEQSYNGLVTVNSHNPALSTPGAIATNAGNGVAFKYGWFQATMSFDPAKLGTTAGWPAFWSAAVEGYTAAPYLEDDFIEFYANSSWPGVGKANIIQTVHQWQNGSGAQFSNTNNAVANQSQFDLTKPLTVGQLWSPMRIESYLNGVKTVSNATTVPVATATNTGRSKQNTFAAANQDYVYLQLGTGQNLPVTFSNVLVCQ